MFLFQRMVNFLYIYNHCTMHHALCTMSRTFTIRFFQRGGEQDPLPPPPRLMPSITERILHNSMHGNKDENEQ